MKLFGRLRTATDEVCERLETRGCDGSTPVTSRSTVSGAYGRQNQFLYAWEAYSRGTDGKDTTEHQGPRRDVVRALHDRRVDSTIRRCVAK